MLDNKENNFQIEKVIIREANLNDDTQIINLVKNHPTSSSLSYVVDRSPSYFKLAEYQGYDYKVLVAESDNIVGSLLISFDKVYLDNLEQKIAYTCDLRVEPFARRTGIADNLMKSGVQSIKDCLGESPNIFTCVLKDNKAGLKKNQNLGRDGLVQMKEVATFKSYFLLPFYTKLFKTKNYNIRFANSNDIEQMFKLWAEINQSRNLARVFTEESFIDWINNSQGLGINNYLIAEKNNQLLGFMGLWNQNKIRRVIIHSQNNQMKMMRYFWNTCSKLLGIPYFPGPNQALNFYNITNLCIKDNDCFKELIYNAFKYVRENNSMFLAIGLDSRDKLNKELKGFISSTTELYLLSNYEIKNNDNIFHPEIALG